MNKARAHSRVSLQGGQRAASALTGCHVGGHWLSCPWGSRNQVQMSKEEPQQHLHGGEQLPADGPHKGP